MPKRTVTENECERCTRTWLTPDSDDTPTVIVRMEHKGARLIDVSYDVLCDSCTKTVANLLKALARDMKKKSPSSDAKREGTDALSEPELDTTGPDASLERTSALGMPRGCPSGPSKQS